MREHPAFGIVGVLVEVPVHVLFAFEPVELVVHEAGASPARPIDLGQVARQVVRERGGEIVRRPLDRGDSAGGVIRVARLALERVERLGQPSGRVVLERRFAARRVDDSDQVAHDVVLVAADLSGTVPLLPAIKVECPLLHPKNFNCSMFLKNPVGKGGRAGPPVADALRFSFGTATEEESAGVKARR